PITCAHTAIMPRNKARDARAAASSTTARIMAKPLRTFREQCSLNVLQSQATPYADVRPLSGAARRRFGCAFSEAEAHPHQHHRAAEDEKAFAAIGNAGRAPPCARPAVMVAMPDDPLFRKRPRGRG